MLKKVFLPLLMTILLFACQSQAQVKNLAADDFEKGIAAKEVQVLDVRTAGEYNSGHIKNSFLADWRQQEEFKNRAQHLDKTRPVYVYCLSGGRSSAAAAWLQQQGFSTVYNLEGGITAWKRNEKPVEGKTEVAQLTMSEYLNQIPANQTVLVDFGAAWCPPCKKMEPVIKDLIATNGKQFTFLPIDGGQQEALSTALKVDAFPTFIIYKNGKEVWRQQGIVSKEELLKQLL